MKRAVDLKEIIISEEIRKRFEEAIEYIKNSTNVKYRVRKMLGMKYGKGMERVKKIEMKYGGQKSCCIKCGKEYLTKSNDIGCCEDCSRFFIGVTNIAKEDKEEFEVEISRQNLGECLEQLAEECLFSDIRSCVKELKAIEYLEHNKISYVNMDVDYFRGNRKLDLNSRKEQLLDLILRRLDEIEERL